MKIVNEQFVLSNVTDEQYKLYFQEKLKTENEKNTLESRNKNSSTNSNGVCNASDNPTLAGLTEQQVQMLNQFSVDSRLNLEWCK
jgi:hypothetical protein